MQFFLKALTKMGVLQKHSDKYSFQVCSGLPPILTVFFIAYLAMHPFMTFSSLNDYMTALNSGSSGSILNAGSLAVYTGLTVLAIMVIFDKAIIPFFNFLDGFKLRMSVTNSMLPFNLLNKEIIKKSVYNSLEDGERIPAVVPFQTYFVSVKTFVINTLIYLIIFTGFFVPLFLKQLQGHFVHNSLSEFVVTGPLIIQMVAAYGLAGCVVVYYLVRSLSKMAKWIANNEGIKSFCNSLSFEISAK